MKERFFELARRMSFKSPSKVKLGCVIVQKNRVVGMGFNHMTKTHPKSPTYGNFLHAELDAIIGLSNSETRNSVAYVYRETQDGNMAKSRPCPVCYGCLKAAGIKKICYSTEKGYKYEHL